MYVCINICLYIYIYKYIYVYILIYIYIWICTHKHRRLYTVHTYSTYISNTQVCVHEFQRVVAVGATRTKCISMCMCVHIHTHTLTHTHMNKHACTHMFQTCNTHQRAIAVKAARIHNQIYISEYFCVLLLLESRDSSMCTPTNVCASIVCSLSLSLAHTHTHAYTHVPG